MLEKWKNFDKKTKILIEIIAVSLIVTLGSTSWAFFSVSGIPQGKDTIITTGTMRLEFSDGQEVSAENFTPGHSITKTFKVKNIGNIDTVYDVYFSELINTFADKDDLVYTLTSPNGCDNSNETVVPSEDGLESRLVQNCQISPNIEHTYSLTITFKETDDNQNDNTGKTFSAKLSVNDYNLAEGLQVANAYIEEANRFYSLNSTSNDLGHNLASTLNIEN